MGTGTTGTKPNTTITTIKTRQMMNPKIGASTILMRPMRQIQMTGTTTNTTTTTEPKTTTITTRTTTRQMMNQKVGAITILMRLMRQIRKIGTTLNTTTTTIRTKTITGQRIPKIGAFTMLM